MTNTKKVLIALLAVFCICAFAFASGSKEPIKIIYTNDAHCGFEDNVGYAGVAALKKSYEAVLGDERVTLIDAGDAIQGAEIGTLSKGSYLVEIMNEIGYDFAIFGNHEFDYGTAALKERLAEANATYLNANIVFTGANKEDNNLAESVPYSIVNYGGTKVAFIGVSTHETIIKSTPSYFMDEAKENYIYQFLDNDELYAKVQGYVNKVRRMGADYVIVVSHLGDVRDVKGIAIAQDLIAHTYGIDVVIDGHSHSTVPTREFKNLINKTVLYTQTGTKLENVGVLTIVPGEGFYAELLQPAEKDADMEAFIANIKERYEATTKTVVAKSAVTLAVNDENGTRIVRNHDTAVGELCADAYRVVSGADIGFANGGGVRATIKAGDITYGDILNVFPYSNYLCVCEATGQEILDALEWGAKNTPAESGGFLIPSGLKYTINTSVKCTCTEDADGMFTGVAGERRVSDVYVGTEETGWTPIDPAKTYTVACHNYKLQEKGDGYTMFYDNVFTIDKTMIDNQLLISYIVDFLGGTIGEEYAAPQGRITIK